jgi:hypothetical protein
MVGGRELLAAVGINLQAAPPLTRSPDEQRHIARAAWRILRRAANPEDVTTSGEIARVNGQAFHVGVDIARFPGAVGSEKGKWIEAFQRISGLSSTLSADAKARLNRHGGDVKIAIEQSQLVAKHVDSVSEPCSPAVSARLDAMIRVHSLHFFRSLKTREPYNAKKNANDVFDLDLLRYLAVPAAICTADKGIHTSLRLTKSWQRRWVVYPNDLASADVRRSVRSIQWPASAYTGEP